MLAAVRSQIEHEKREVVGNVKLPEPPVELDAIDDPHPAVHQHVFRPQVTVSLAKATLPASILERLGVGDDERVREALQREHPVDLTALLQRPKQLVNVLLEPSLDRQNSAIADSHTARVSVESGQDSGDRDDLLAIQLPALKPRRERLSFVIATHLNHEINRPRIVIGSQLESVRPVGDTAYTEIDVGGQLPVQTHLLPAHLPPPCRGAVVEKRQD